MRVIGDISRRATDDINRKVTGDVSKRVPGDMNRRATVVPVWREPHATSAGEPQ